MRSYKKPLRLGLVFFLLSLVGCQNYFDSSSNSGSSSAEITVGIDPNLTSVHSQTLTAPQKVRALALPVGAVGVMQVTNTADASVTSYPWPITYDSSTFTLISNKTIVLSPGIYDFAFLVTIDNHQYAGSANAITISDDTGTNIPLTVNAVIGDTDITVEVVSELPEFKFSYSASELVSLTTPKIGIIIDSGAEAIFDLDPSMGVSNQYVSISQGAHTLELKLYDGATQVGKSIDAQESVIVVAGQDIPMDLIPLSGQATFTLTEAGGDATFNFTVPNEIVTEAGGSNNLGIIFKMSGATNNPVDVSLPIVTDNGDGTSGTSYTHTDMQAEAVTLSLEFYDNTNNDLLGSCTMTDVVLNVNGTSALCSISLVRRAVIQGSILATIGVNVYDTGYLPIAGVEVSENGNGLGLTNSGSFGTAGFLQFNLQQGTYTIRAESPALGKYGEVTITTAALDVDNYDIILDQDLVFELGKITFTSDRDGNWEVYVMNADGSGQTNLTNNGAHEVHSVFSSDGSKIAFMACKTITYRIQLL